ncbi:EG45-like domain containing protein [Chenopodium quinoa]|uniref:EG45-like domain containing protein n=1 Tax=Chenopodium quinoa TaxID=63459 RepID=UPI000B77330D|nr:EG45-like domain containing protein [Chenopodium quinoa]
MASLVHSMIVIAIFASFASVAIAIPGTATYYTTYVPSSCYGFEDQGTMIAAASADIFQNRAACGRMYRVTCTSGTNQGVPQPCRGGSVTVKVVDLCPGCSANGLDLSMEAFSVIADPNAGRINIDYTPV